MAMFASYFDTSGTKSTGTFMFTVGLVAPVGRWQVFEREWEVALQGLPYIYMKKFVAGVRPFEAVKNDTEKKRAILSGLQDVLRRHVETFSIFGLDLKGYRVVDQEYPLTEYWGSPFALCAGSSVIGISKQMRATYAGFPVEYFHEDGDMNPGKIREMLRRENISLMFKDKIQKETEKWFVPFQATDMLAWEYRRGEDDMHNPKQHMRGSFMRLIHGTKMRGRLRFLGEDGLRRFCRRYPHVFPPRRA